MKPNIPRAVRWPSVVALLLAAAAAAASLYVSAMVFERMPHVEDEFANLWQAEVMARGRLWIESPREPASFVVPFVVDHDGRRFGKYPPGWPALLALGAAADAPYLVNAGLAALAVWLTFRLGARLAGTIAGLLAALLLATSPMILMLSGSMMSHVWTVVLTLAWMLAWFDLFPEGGGPARQPARLLVSVAGLSLGVMALTRPLTALGVALPFAPAALVSLIRGGVARRHVIGIGVLAAAVAGLLLVWQWAVTGNALLNPYTLWWPYDRIGFGPGIGPLPEGHTLKQAILNTHHSLFAWQHDLFGWPYLSWILIPVGLMALRKRRDAWVSAAILPSLVLVHLAYWVGSWLLGPRYFVEAVPALAAVSAAGVTRLAGSLRSSGAVRLRPLAVVALMAALVTLDVGVYVPVRVGGLHGLYGITREKMAPLENTDLAEALVIVHAEPNWTAYGTLLMLTAPFRRDGALLLALSRDPVQDGRLEQAYPGRIVYHYYTGDPTRLYPTPKP
ncbi:MAG TPA: hypothetical protein VLD63_09125 [Anaerolineales bacterium]|nr:hypothetical protein [Anaerolineales bacterium]